MSDSSFKVGNGIHGIRLNSSSKIMDSLVVISKCQSCFSSYLMGKSIKIWFLSWIGEQVRIIGGKFVIDLRVSDVRSLITIYRKSWIVRHLVLKSIETIMGKKRS